MVSLRSFWVLGRQVRAVAPGAVRTISGLGADQVGRRNEGWVMMMTHLDVLIMTLEVATVSN